MWIIDKSEMPLREATDIKSNKKISLIPEQPIK